MARAISRVGEPAYLYLLTWVDTGKRARLGACHGEELYFLGESFPHDWEPVDGEKTFGEILRRYWTNFAKRGNPDGVDVPEWRPYHADSDLVMELGRQIHPVPVSSSLPTLQRLMQPVLRGEAR